MDGLAKASARRKVVIRWRSKFGSVIRNRRSANRWGHRHGHHRSGSDQSPSLDGLSGILRSNRQRLEPEDVPLAWNLKEAHAMRHRFFKSVKIVPVVVIYAVGSDDGAGAVRAALAVHEDGTGCVAFKQRQYRSNLCLSGWGEASHRNVHILHPVGSNGVLFC